LIWWFVTSSNSFLTFCKSARSSSAFCSGCIREISRFGLSCIRSLVTSFGTAQISPLLNAVLISIYEFVDRSLRCLANRYRLFWWHCHLYLSPSNGCSRTSDGATDSDSSLSVIC
jgi:hypothetical protein